jgi:hypothetical protein
MARRKPAKPAAKSRSIERRIRNTRFPVLKTLEEFQWSWPKKINRPQIQNLFRLAFIATHTNVVLIGNVGLGKTHLSIALGHAACLNGHTALFIYPAQPCFPARSPLVRSGSPAVKGAQTGPTAECQQCRFTRERVSGGTNRPIPIRATVLTRILLINRKREGISFLLTCESTIRTLSRSLRPIGYSSQCLEALRDFRPDTYWVTVFGYPCSGCHPYVRDRRRGLRPVFSDILDTSLYEVLVYAFAGHRKRDAVYDRTARTLIANREYHYRTIVVSPDRRCGE